MLTCGRETYVGALVTNSHEESALVRSVGSHAFIAVLYIRLCYGEFVASGNAAAANTSPCFTLC